jgi:serine/threonine protein kinase/Tol biopolymer transport system component
VADDARPLDDLAEDVLEGRPVDWTSAESSPDPQRREAVRQLKVLAGIAGIHRNVGSASTERAELDIWGRLRILERIGRGSFGVVYRAWDPKLDREVALKLLRTDATPEGVEVLREARLLARVRHPNVVTVYDADEIGGHVGLWMEFVRGHNLEQILQERQRLVEHEATEIGIEVCRAMAAVHGAGLLHRDMKAQNVMRADDGRIVLMDFGTGREAEVPPTEAADAAGTPLYVAPEVLAGAPASVEADVYSFGVLLFHLLTGTYPVRASNLEGVRTAHARGERLSLSSASADVSRALALVISRAIDPDPSKRFRSAKAMLEALENVQRAVESRRRTRNWLAGTALLVAVAVVAAVVRQDGGRDRPSQGALSPYFGSSAEKRAVHTPQAMIPGTPSPDGRFFPYSELGTGNLAIYEFATGTSRVLTRNGDGGDENYATESIVSSDDHRLAYSWEDGSCGCSQLRVIDSDGANERTLYGGPGKAEVLPLEWSSDGGQILGRRRQGGSQTEIVLVSVVDGSVRVVRTVSGLGHVSLSPDGRVLAYDRVDEGPDARHAIFVAPTAGDSETLVVRGPTSDSDPMWTPDGSALVFASTRTGGPGLWLQGVRNCQPDGKPRLLDKDMGLFAPVTLTKRGSLFYDHRTGLMDVYTAPIDPSTGEVVGEPSNAASHDQGSNINADWSPDGDSLVFASWRTSKRNILVFRSFKTGAERAIELDAPARGVQWSPDGRSVAIPAGLVDVDSGVVSPTHLAPYNSFVWDSDSRHAYVSRLGGERPGIARADVLTGEEEVLYQPPPQSILGNLSLSPDGRWLAFGLMLQPTQTAQLLVLSTTGGQPRELFRLPNAEVAFGIGEWTRDGQRVLFVQTHRDSERKHVGELWAVSRDGKAPLRVGLSMRALRDVRVSPDGTRISFTAGYPDTDLWVFENFLPRTDAPNSLDPVQRSNGESRQDSASKNTKR